MQPESNAFGVVSRIVSRAFENEVRSGQTVPFVKNGRERESIEFQLFPFDSQELAEIYSLPPLATWVTYHFPPACRLVERRFSQNPALCSSLNFMFHEPQIDRDEQISAFYFLSSSAVHYPSSVALHFRATETQTRDRALPRASSTENSEGPKDLFDTQMSENLLPDGRDSSIVSLNALFLVLGTSFSPNGST